MCIGEGEDVDAYLSLVFSLGVEGTGVISGHLENVYKIAQITLCGEACMGPESLLGLFFLAKKLTSRLRGGSCGMKGWLSVLPREHGV